MFSILVVMTVSQVNAYIQNHHNVYVKCMQFFLFSQQSFKKELLIY